MAYPLENAYDHVNWDFLHYILRHCGFGAKCKKWISAYISTAHFSILINSSPNSSFGSSWGFRQGDPLSLRLFVLVMDALSRILYQAMVGGFLSGFRANNIDPSSLEVSHLLFTHDILIMCDANSEHIHNLDHILLCFEAVSGLKINLQKSESVAVGRFLI
jgi:hypothetical protein